MNEVVSLETLMKMAVVGDFDVSYTRSDSDVVDSAAGESC
jgi:hypothetical protein